MEVPHSRPVLAYPLPASGMRLASAIAQPTLALCPSLRYQLQDEKFELEINWAGGQNFDPNDPAVGANEDKYSEDPKWHSGADDDVLPWGVRDRMGVENLNRTFYMAQASALLSRRRRLQSTASNPHLPPQPPRAQTVGLGMKLHEEPDSCGGRFPCARR